MRTIAAVLPRLHFSTARSDEVAFGREPGLLPRVLLLSALLHVWLALSVGLRTGPADPARSGRGGPLVMVLEGWGTAPQGHAETEVPDVPPDGPPGTAPTRRHGGVVRPAVDAAPDTPGARRLGRWQAQETQEDRNRPDVEREGGARGADAVASPAPSPAPVPPVQPVPEPSRLSAPAVPERVTPSVPAPEVQQPATPGEPVPASPEVPQPAPLAEPDPTPPVEPVLRVLAPEAPQPRERTPSVERVAGTVPPTALDAQALSQQLAQMRERLAAAEAQALRREAAAEAAAQAASAPTPAPPRWLAPPAEPRPRSTVERLRPLNLPPDRSVALTPPPALPPPAPEAPEPVLRTLTEAAQSPQRPMVEAVRQPRLEAPPMAAPSPVLPRTAPRLDVQPEPADVPAAAPLASNPNPAPGPTVGPAPGQRISPGAPDAGPRVGHDVATAPSAAASAPPPPLNLSLPRNSAAGPRRGLGLLELLPALPPERKNKMEQAVEDAQREDCRKAHQEKGLLALGPMALEALRSKGCKW